MSKVRLHPEVWRRSGCIGREDREMLVRPFSMEEVSRAVKEMKTNTAPGPDGFSVQFYKEFWDRVKPLVKEMLDEMFVGKLDLGRLNYGVITLIPKIKDANVIR